MAEWIKKHWKVVVAVGAGAVGLYLLWQRSQGGVAPAAAAPTDAGLPSTGAAPVDTGASSGAPPQYLNAGEQAAAGLAQYQAQQAAYPQPLSIQQQISNAEQQEAAFLATNPISGATATGTIQQRWKQVVDAGQTFWVDVSGKNRAPISEQLAELEAQVPKGEGPYYQSAGGTGISGFINQYIIKPAEQVFRAGLLTPSTAQGAPVQSYDTSGVNQSPTPTPQEIASLNAFYPTPTGAPVAIAQGNPVHMAHGPTTPHGIPNHAVGAH